ncbi:FG-GAP-like repeat-containing protein [Pirellulales bacterium]|nr:FG-GAP-like repeat-containing protein [Pirellulales bacterium]
MWAVKKFGAGGWRRLLRKADSRVADSASGRPRAGRGRRLHYQELEPRHLLTVVLQYEFAETSTGVPVADNMATLSTPFGTAGLKDDSPNNLEGQFNTFNNQPGPTVNYATTSIPVIPDPLPNGWDGRALRFDGDTFIRHYGGPLEFNDSFTAFARILREGSAGTSLETVMGSGNQPNNGWDVFLDPVTHRLDVSFRGGLDNVYGGLGPTVNNNQWVDVGVTFEGTNNDAIADTLRVYINGALHGTFVGAAAYDSATTPGSINFSFGGDGYGNQRFAGLYERLVLWDEVLDASAMAALSSELAPPPTGTISLDFDGGDEPFYTTPNLGETLPLGEVNAAFDAGQLPLEVHAHSESQWQLLDCCGGDHFLSGPTNSLGADFFGHFDETTAAERIALDVGFYEQPTTATLTAYGEIITDSTNAGLAGLTTVGSQTLQISGQDLSGSGGEDERNFHFSLVPTEPARSFVLEVLSSTVPGINLIEFDAIAVEPPPPPAARPRPTEFGEWWQFRGDRQLTGRAEMVGNITELVPEVIWSQFVGSRQAWTALTPSTSQSDTVSLPTTNVNISRDDKIEWGLGGPYFDLNENGFLTEVAQSFWFKIGDFLPAVTGLEKVELELQSDGDGIARLYRRQGASWIQVWQSLEIPQLQLVPSVITGDFDNDSQLELAVTAWYDVYVLDLGTGVIEGHASFNPPGADSGRPYGWHGAFDFNNDNRDELVVLGDYENKIGVVGYDAGGNLQTLWTRMIEPQVVRKKTLHHPGVNPVEDITGDGIPEIVTSIYDEFGDKKWHIMAFNGMTGEVILDLPDHYLTGMRDIDQDGNAELFTTVALNGPAPSTMGHIKVMDFDNRVLTSRWEQTDAGFQTGLVQDYPSNVNGWTGTGRRTLLADVIFDTESRPAFFTRELVDAAAGTVAITAWRADVSGQIDSLGVVSGPNLDVIATQAAAGLPGVLLQSEVPGDIPDQLDVTGFTTATAYSAQIRPGQTSVVVGRMDGIVPTVIVGGATERLVAFQVDQNGQTNVQWTTPGRGEFTGGANFTGQYGTGNVLLAELTGDGTLATVAATQTEDGLARMVAIAPDGSEIWHTDFNVPGPPPIWNSGGITTWKAGRFRFTDRDDVLVSVRQSSFQSGIFYLLDGQTGEIVWSRDWGPVPGSTSHDRGAGGSQLAIFDWDNDGLDEAVNIYPDAYYVVDGNGTNLINQGQANGAVYPGIWPQGGIPIVDDFLDDGSMTVLDPGSLNVVGLLDRNGQRIWHNPGSFSQFSPAVGDWDGDGDLELFLDEAAYAAESGAFLWSRTLAGTPGPGVSADIDGDGRDEIIVTSGNRLYVIGSDDQGSPGQIESTMLFSGTLGMPIVADADGDGWLEIIVVSDNGTISAIGQRPAVLAGDFDEDGAVSGRDFLFWQMGLGITSGAEHADGDGDRDGDVDRDDNLIWQSQFGAVHDSAGAVAAFATESAQNSSATISSLPVSQLDQGDTATIFFFDRLFGDIGAADGADFLVWQSQFDAELGGGDGRDAAVAMDLVHRNSPTVPSLPASPLDRGDAATSSLFDEPFGNPGVADSFQFSPTLRDRIARAFARRMRQ